MAALIGRRHVFAGAGAALGLGALSGCGALLPDDRRGTRLPRLHLAPIRTGIDRITNITVCTRPFRAEGPRIEIERFGRKSVVHHYGHGGSGWSLSWGSGAVAVALTMSTGEREIGVIGCGAIGLTTAILLQRAGAEVTIYTKELPPDIPSAYASGVWSPDSRICLEEHATPAFKSMWAGMCRRSFRAYQGLIGLPGHPVEWIDSYYVPTGSAAPPPHADSRPKFAELRRELVPDLSPQGQSFAPGTHPFGEREIRRNSFMMFNIGPYFRMLMSDFLGMGGRVVVREFHTPAELAELPQNTLVNCTGYGARALFGDQSLVPVRGQLARTMPQPGIDYGLFHNQVSFIPRRDGFVFQMVGADDYYGFGDASIAPSRSEAELAVRTIAGLFSAV